MRNAFQKITLILFSCLLLSSSAFAQRTISGKVTDATNQPQPYLSVLFLNASDSVYVNGVVTDGDGKFTATEKNAGTYLLHIKGMGTIPYYKEVTLNDKDMDLGTITLTADPKLLKEVNISGTKKLIEFSGDKMVMDLSVSPVTSGLTALELLSKVPGVSVNKQSQTIQIAGKTGVMVMIDGRPTNLTGDQLAAMLKSMKSDEFEKVEVITNPSAKYDAEGTSGIINLKTKSGKMYGTNYTLNLGGGYSSYKKFGNYPKYNEGFSVSVKRKKFTSYVNLSHNRGTDLSWTEESRSFLDANKSVLEKQQYTELDKGENHFFSGIANLDFYLFKNTMFGFSVNSSIFNGNKESRQEQQIDNGDDLNLYNINTNKKRSDLGNYTLTNAHMKQVFDTLGTELLIDVDVIIHNMDFKNSFDVHRLSASNDQQSSYNISRIDRPRIYVIRSSFEKQLTKKTKLEIGYRSSVSNTNTDFASDFVAIDSLKQFTYNFLQNVNAAYVIIKTQLGSKMDLEAGLRAEHTYTLGTNGAKKKLSEQNYVNLFPSFSLNRKFDQYALSLGYSRRIGRPNPYNLNVFKLFISPMNYQQGNPTLIASLNNSYNVSATIKDKYFIELSYVNRKNDFAEILETDTLLIPGYRLSRSMMGNVKGKVSWLALRGYIPIEVNKLWTINLQLNAVVNDYNYTLNEARTKVQQFCWAISCQQNFSITETFSAELNAWVNSGETYGFQTGKTMGAIDIGFSKKIFKNNGSLKLSLQDPFNFCNYKADFNYDYLSGKGQYNWDNRSILLNFTYNFGNQNVQIRQWQSKFREASAEQKK
jgi:hypothetical protein